MTCSFFLERRHGGALGVLHGLARDQGFWEVDQGRFGRAAPTWPWDTRHNPDLTPYFVY
jgi:hypothetical protein